MLATNRPDVPTREVPIVQLQLGDIVWLPTLTGGYVGPWWVDRTAHDDHAVRIESGDRARTYSLLHTCCVAFNALESKAKVIAILHTGGNFDQALARLLTCADEANLRRAAIAFRERWVQCLEKHARLQQASAEYNAAREADAAAAAGKALVDQ